MHMLDIIKAIEANKSEMIYQNSTLETLLKFTSELVKEIKKESKFLKELYLKDKTVD